MKTPNCKHFDFAYETFEGEKCVYCSVSKGKIPRRDCGKGKCIGYEPKAAAKQQAHDNKGAAATTNEGKI